MTTLNKIYKCEICGNIVHVIHTGQGQLVCCGQPMSEIEEQTTDITFEKHVPIIEQKENGFLVTVGDTPHPMLDNHYIEWIELVADGISYRQYLKPGEKPEAFFCAQATSITAREYCNLHNLWQSTIE